MSVKVIQITIPSENVLPDIINSFSPEENYQMLKIGCETLNEGRKSIVNLTSNQIFKKVESEFKKEIDKLNMDIVIEKNTAISMNEKMIKMYETQIEKLNKKVENTLSELEVYKQGNLTSFNEEINKVKEKYDLLLKEKDRQNQLNREIFDKAEKLINKTNKSSISIGGDGEQIFETLADTFKDFPEYRIENKSKQGHKGDFHLFFKDFNILVDSKNYSGCVQKKEIIKIESDLTINDNVKFAWMVSLNSNISDYNKFPIMTKWITTDTGVKCILFINNLLEHKEPRNILRQVWSICNYFNKLTKNIDKEDGELEEYIEKNLLYKKQIEKLQERASELRRSVNTSYNILKHMDNDLLEMLSNVSDKIVSDKFDLNNKIKEWWDNNIEYVNDDSKITSTELWTKFKKDNKNYVEENKILIELFKNEITGIVKSSTYIEKTKKSVIEFIGFRWKQIEITPINNLEMENVVIEKVKKVKPVKKEKCIDSYFDVEKDTKILKDYDNVENDIMTMSNNDVRPWQIVSLLMKNKVILKRDDARGYDKYKETAEYKNKFNKE
jgi:hypothetical protein